MMNLVKAATLGNLVNIGLVGKILKTFVRVNR